MRIGVLTFHRAYNCGAMLQAWALQRVLQRLGHVVEFPVCNHVGETGRWCFDWICREKRGIALVRSLLGRAFINLSSIPAEDIRIHRYCKFRSSFINERDCRIDEFDKYYDAVVVGSDQVWSDVHSLNDAPLFFGECLPQHLRKIAYAASSGDMPLQGMRLERVIAAANRFEAVSVRENLLQGQLLKSVSKDIPVLLDPTLLPQVSDYVEVEAHEHPKEPYLLMYTIPIDSDMYKIARELAKRLGVRCVIAPCYQYGRYKIERDIMSAISPDRLISYTRHATYVVAGSFHGTVMGVLFNKPTISLRDHVDQFESRPATLLNALGCGERLANPNTSIDNMVDLLATGFSDENYEKLASLRKKSVHWLTEALG